MDIETRRKLASEAFNSATLSLINAVRKETEQKTEKEKEEIKLAVRDKPANDNSVSEKLERQYKTESDKKGVTEPKIAVTFFVGNLEMEIQGYGKIKIEGVQFGFGAYSRSSPVPTNLNSVVLPESGASGFVHPYYTNEFDKAA